MPDLTKIDHVGGTSIYSVKGHPPSFLYVAGMIMAWGSLDKLRMLIEEM
jgi:hypothetical protein